MARARATLAMQAVAAAFRAAVVRDDDAEAQQGSSLTLRSPWCSSR